MAKCYFEKRNRPPHLSDNLLADCMRHVHARQHMGKVVIIGDNPLTMMRLSRKQWFKLSRNLQRKRAATINADRILKFTYTITHMQHMQFTCKTPLEQPDADIYFLQPSALQAIPLHCLSVYITSVLPLATITELVAQLPAHALVIDYRHQIDWETLGLQPKAVLEQQVSSEWRHIEQFFTAHHIRLNELIANQPHKLTAMDDALDELLSVSYQFLQAANSFQQTLEQARPLQLSQAKRQQYDILALLAHRVQALTPGAFSQQFLLKTYNEDDTFFLHDIAYRRLLHDSASLLQLITKHHQAGRLHLANALAQVVQVRSP